MIVETILHGKAVFRRLLEKARIARNVRWMVLDSETRAKEPHPPNDALVIGRAETLIWSSCVLGESYSFPTSNFSLKYPTMEEWADALLTPLGRDPEVIKVFHNANYDVSSWGSEVGLYHWLPLWCTMIGGWKANAQIVKGLKARASLYGRFLKETKHVDFGALPDLSVYAEEDVIQTDELFQMQMFGYVERKRVISRLMPDTRRWEKFEDQAQPLPAGKIIAPHEDLNPREKRELELQEFPYLRATIRAERKGVPFSVKRLKKRRRIVAKRLKVVLKRIYRTAGRTLNLGSSKQLNMLFTELGIKSPVVTKKGAPSWNAFALKFLEQDHPMVRDVQSYRQLSKLASTYLGVDGAKHEKRGLEHYVAPDGRIRALSNTVGAVTGRTSCQKPNLTQIPSAKDIVGIKDCFFAPKGLSFLCLDYAQLELRVGTMYHRDPAMMRVLRDPKGDLHQNTADEFGVPRDPTSKNINFLFQFGGGAYVLSNLLTFHGVPTTPEQASPMEKRYNEVYYRVREWRREELIPEHQRNGYVRLLTKRTRSLGAEYPWDNWREFHKAETTLSNNVVQGAGQDFLKAAVIRMDYCNVNPDRATLRSGLEMKSEHIALLKDYARFVDQARKEMKLAKCSWLLQVHDEALALCDTHAAEDMLMLLAKIMAMRHYLPSWRPYCVPLVVDGGVGKTWKQAKSKTAKFRVHYGFENEIDE